MIFSIFPLITDVTMADKCLDEDQRVGKDILGEDQKKVPLMSGQEMRRVLDDVGNEFVEGE